MSEINTLKNTENLQTVGDFLNFAVKYFAFPLSTEETEKETEKTFLNPQLEAEMLLSFALGKERVWLRTHQDYILNAKESAKFREIIERRKNNEPLAYIRGWKIWCDMKIVVSPDVLIPRDETEILANYILKNSRNFKPKTILDVGTGSGCLAIFLAKKFPRTEVTALDICPKALNIAKKNAQNQQVQIKFLQSDLLEKISRKNFDIIVANLPYVPENISVSKDVRKEPAHAIFSGADGLDLIRKLAEQLKFREILFRELWLEFWPAQETEIKKIFAEYNVEFLPDLGGDTYFAKITMKK